MTILASLAQDESRSISENSTWGIRRQFEQGKVRVNHKKFLGYGKDKDGDELRKHRTKEFIEVIEKGNIEEFDIDLFYRMIEKMAVFEDKIIVGFLDGTEVECVIE